MPDGPDSGSNETRAEWQNPLLKSTSQASEVLSAQAHEPPPATSLYGTSCRTQPQDGELPVLKPGVAGTGCQFEKFASDSPTAVNYRAAAESSAHLYEKAGEWTSTFAIGSGFAVAASADTCYVLTDNHVVAGSEDVLQLKLADGKLHEGTVVAHNDKIDLAAIAVVTGDDTAKVCKPVKLPDSKDVFVSGIEHGDTLDIIGYPAQAHNLYVSNGTHSSVIKRSDYRDGDGDGLGLLPGENPDRGVILIDAHAEGGNSGSSVYNKGGEVGAVLDVGDSNKLRSAFATPIDKAIVRSMLPGVEIK